MKKFRILTVVVALVCAFGMLGLTACGGGGGNSSGGSSGEPKNEQPAPEPEPTDEELITEDIEKIFSTALSADALLAGLRADDSMKQLEEMGINLEDYAENMAKTFKFKANEINVDGDTAVAKCTLSVPEFGEESDKLMDKALEKATKGKDTTKMSRDEQVKIFSDVMNDVLSDPDFPSNKTDIDIDYVKKDGTWTIKDLDAFKSLLSSSGNAAAGL